MDFLKQGILLCKVGETDLGLLGITCDFIFEKFLYLGLLTSSITNNSIMMLIIHLILLGLFFYVPYKYITSKKVCYFFILLFFVSLFFLNVKYLFFVIILDIILYFAGLIFRKFNNLKKLSSKQLHHYFMYGKFIPILGYFYSLRIGLTNKLTIKQLFSGVIVSNINLIISFIFIGGFLNQFDWFYRSELLNNELWWQNERLLYTEIGPFIIIYLIGVLLYFLKYRKI